MDVGDIGAVVAAVASLGALATGIYAARYTSRQTARLELAKWYRERLSADVTEILHVCRDMEGRLMHAQEDVPSPTLYTDEFHKQLVGLSHVAPPRLAAATYELQVAAQNAGMWLSALADPASYANTDSRTYHRDRLATTSEAFRRAAQAEMGMR